MKKKFLSAGPWNTFYFVFAYIFSFVLWWAYLLYAQNETNYKEKVELNEIAYHQTHMAGSYSSTPEFVAVHSKYRRQKVMIISEAFCFGALLIFGLTRVRKVLLREMELAELQRNFLLSITHELKSPISTVKLSLQTIATRSLDAETSKKLITNSLSDIDRLESLVDNILFAAKIERDEPGFSNEELDISELVQRVCDRFSHNKKSITIKTNIEPDVSFFTDQIGFTSVIINLVENAIKYSEAGTKITIGLKRNNGKVLLSVADQGIGISREDKKRVFEKFYRVGNEDVRKTKGTGLGLYIVRRFVQIYKGRIAIDDNTPRGSIFRLSFDAPV